MDLSLQYLLITSSYIDLSILKVTTLNYSMMLGCFELHQAT